MGVLPTPTLAFPHPRHIQRPPPLRWSKQFFSDDSIDPSSRSVEVARDLEARLNALKRQKSTNHGRDDFLEQLERFDSGASSGGPGGALAASSSAMAGGGGAPLSSSVVMGAGHGSVMSSRRGGRRASQGSADDDAVAHAFQRIEIVGPPEYDSEKLQVAVSAACTGGCPGVGGVCRGWWHGQCGCVVCRGWHRPALSHTTAP